VFDRLDLVCGQRWTAGFEELPKPLLPPPCDRDGQPLARPPIDVRCRLTAFGVTREDVGEGEDPKAAFSDAIKRAAVQFGIGRALYALRLPWLREGDGDGELRRNRRGRLVLDARSEAWCREQYGRWLERRGLRLFGEPLDHGDDPGASGFEAEADGPSGEEPPAEVDQAPAGGLAIEPRRPAEAEQPPAQGDGSAAPASAAPERPQTVQGRLRAVSDGTPGEPPATALDRRQIAHWQAVGRYKEETVAALAALACGERVLERLTHPQVKRLSWLLECAIRGRVSQRSLAGTITRLSKRDQRDQAAEELERWLAQKADEVGLLGRREAA
jgi:hypothetical protein